VREFEHSAAAPMNTHDRSNNGFSFSTSNIPCLTLATCSTYVVGKTNCCALHVRECRDSRQRQRQYTRIMSATVGIDGNRSRQLLGLFAHRLPGPGRDRKYRNDGLVEHARLKYSDTPSSSPPSVGATTMPSLPAASELC